MIDPRTAIIRDLLGDRHLIVVSNREPYEHHHSGRGILVHRPAGGLAAALDPVLQATGGTWVAWGSGDADFEVADDTGHLRVPVDEPTYALRRVRLPDAEVDGYYYGYANQGLWPLCHMATKHVRFRPAHWVAYQSANRRFAEATLAEASAEALVWVHDYHLALCPRYLRQGNPDLFIMSFWHIPWPEWNVLRSCPQRGELLDGLLATDLLGLQHPLYVQRFLDCAARELGARVDREESTLDYDGHLTHVQAFPISVDAAGLERIAHSVACERWITRLRERYAFGDRRIALSVDRLDYTKGIPERLQAVDALFQRVPSWRDRVVFIQKTAPSRTQIKAYRDLQTRVGEEVARINAAHSTPGWRPIIHLLDPLPQEGLAALYRMADVCIVSSLADGMNVVAKEFVACQVDQRGVLVLSELAGARDELPWAIPINPRDAQGVARAVEQALRLAPEERRARMTNLRAYVAEHDIYRWMADHLRTAGRLLASRAARPWVLEDAEAIRHLVMDRPLGVLMDFDGTLVPIMPTPDAVTLRSDVRETLARLVGRRDILVAVISGRALEDVRQRIGVEGLVYAGNHGLEIAWPDGTWTLPEAEAARADVAAVCRSLLDRLGGIAGVIIEDKGLTGSVHFRQVATARRDEVRVAVLEEARGKLLVREGKQVWELWPNVAWTKGAASRFILERAFGPAWADRASMIYVGDDRTDEEAFMVLPQTAVTVKVGRATRVTAARYVARDAQDVARLLAVLVA